MATSQRVARGQPTNRRHNGSRMESCGTCNKLQPEDLHGIRMESCGTCNKLQPEDLHGIRMDDLAKGCVPSNPSTNSNPGTFFTFITGGSMTWQRVVYHPSIHPQIPTQAPASHSSPVARWPGKGLCTIHQSIHKIQSRHLLHIHHRWLDDLAKGCVPSINPSTNSNPGTCFTFITGGSMTWQRVGYHPSIHPQIPTQATTKHNAPHLLPSQPSHRPSFPLPQVSTAPGGYGYVPAMVWKWFENGMEKLRHVLLQDELCEKQAEHADALVQCHRLTRPHSHKVNDLLTQQVLVGVVVCTRIIKSHEKANLQETLSQPRLAVWTPYCGAM